MRNRTPSLHGSDCHRKPSAPHPLISIAAPSRCWGAEHKELQKERRSVPGGLGNWEEERASSAGLASWEQRFLKTTLQVWFKKIISHKLSQGSQEETFLFFCSQIFPVLRLLKWGLLGHTSLPSKIVRWEGEGVRWTGNLGLIDANYCLWNG